MAQQASHGQPAIYNATLPTLTDGDFIGLNVDNRGRLITSSVGADTSASVQKVEQQFSYSGVLTSDTAVKGSAGFVHTITLSCTDSAPTAGTIIIYDNTAESGTAIFDTEITTTFFYPITVTLDVVCATGIYAGFTTTADVNVQISYR